MRMRPITMSLLPIVARCPASWALPHAEEAEPSEPSQRGTAIHAFLADVSERGRDAALERVPPEYRAACEAIDTDRIPSHLGAEVTFRLDVRSDEAQEIGRDIDRSTYADMAEDPWVIYGTADLVGIGGGVVVVYDYKTGWSEQDRAEDHWQLRGLALAAARAYGTSHARVGIIRVPENGNPWYDVAEIDAFELDQIAADLARVLDQRVVAIEDLREGRTPTVTTGRHCRYCPAFLSCPAQVGLLRAVAAAPEKLDEEIAALTPEHAAKAYHRISQVRMVLDRAEKQLRSIAERQPIDLGNGRKYGPVEQTREKIVGDVALPVLREHFGAEVAEAAAEISVTKTRLRDALRGYAQRTGEKITHLERQALEVLRQNDCIEETFVTKLAEYEAEKVER